MKIFEIIHSHCNYVKPTLAPHPQIISTEMLGLEIELENVSSRLRSMYWVEKSDGSLRNNGREFVFRGPIGGVDLFNALTEIGVHLRTIRPAATWRCSTHVHMDVRDLSVMELKRLILLYVIYEELLFKCSGPNRYNNNFGPAFGFAQGQIDTLSKIWHLEGATFLDRVLNMWSKYSSLNLLPIGRFGSVEFRIANALTTSRDLLMLCNRFLLLKKLAVEWEDSLDALVKHFATTNIHRVFPVSLTGLRRAAIDQGFAERGAILANDILYLAAKNREGLSHNGMILTNLSASRVSSLRNVAERDLVDSESVREAYEWLCEIYDNGSWREIPLERAKMLIDVFGVSRTWVAHPDFVHLLND